MSISAKKRDAFHRRPLQVRQLTECLPIVADVVSWLFPRSSSLPRSALLMFKFKYERKQYGQGRNCGIHTSTQQTEVWPNAVANKYACKGHNCTEGHTFGMQGPPHELRCSPCGLALVWFLSSHSAVVMFAAHVMCQTISLHVLWLLASDHPLRKSASLSWPLVTFRIRNTAL